VSSGLKISLQFKWRNLRFLAERGDSLGKDFQAATQVGANLFRSAGFVSARFTSEPAAFQLASSTNKLASSTNKRDRSRGRSQSFNPMFEGRESIFGISLFSESPSGSITFLRPSP
jgi:hypothetical protein